MSRIANAPISLPAGVEVKINGNDVSVKGGKGEMALAANKNVEVTVEENVVKVSARDGAKFSRAIAGTTRALINNMVVGVSAGFEKKLTLIGVGYRAKASAQSVSLSLGFSHPVDYALPKGVVAETPSNTEIVIKGIDKQKVGQVAAEIREFRPPEPYKGKGVRYSDEHVRRKETKKK